MLGLNDVLGQPKEVENLGKVYPVTLDKYEDFMTHAQILQYTKKHFHADLQEFTLFELAVSQLISAGALDSFKYMLFLVTDKEWHFYNAQNEQYMFISDDSVLNNKNFDEFRDVVMKQNLMYEDRVFKSPMLKRWADKVLDARSKNGADVTLEDIVGVVHIFTGVPYHEIAQYTLYQLKYTFQRVIKLEAHRASVTLLPHREDGKVEPFVDKVELYKHPYDDVFVEKSKLDGLNKAIGNK